MRGGRLSIIAFSTLVCGCSEPAAQKWELVNAMLSGALQDCVPPNERERARFELAAAAVETGGDNPDWLDIGGQKFLATAHARAEGTRRVPVCIPDDVLKRAADGLAARKAPWRGRLADYQLELAARLPARSEHIVDAVAKSAFNERPQESDLLRGRDIRPLARTALASFGMQSAPYGNRAFEQISIKDSMGTGAAQVAAAAGHPEALPRIQQMMEQALSAVQADKAVPWHTRNRLYELAWAIAYAGEAGKKHTRPIHHLMQRKVESWAPPFGMLELQPKRLCSVLKRIEGGDAIKAYPFCLDEKVPFEQ